MRPSPSPKITPKFVVAVVEQAREIATEERLFRIRPRVGLAVVLTATVCMSWGVIRSTRAQEAAKLQPPSAKEVVPPPPLAPSPISVPPLAGELVPEASVPRLPDSAPASEVSPPPGALANPDMNSGSLRLSSLETDDPEKNVQSFVEQNRKVAETHLRSLKDEGEKLRARLQKVERGISRWEAVLSALEKSSPAASPKGLTLTGPRPRENPLVGEAPLPLPENHELRGPMPEPLKAAPVSPKPTNPRPLEPR